MPFRALVVEDEPPAREELRHLLREADAAMEVETADTAMEALRRLRTQPFDALFADIQMPGLSGLELVELVNGLVEPPAVVFVTAYDEYAVRAFDLRAADYLLKPVGIDRLRETLERLLRGRERRLASEPQPQRSPVWLERLPIESAGKTALVDLAEIRFAEAKGDIVYVRTTDRSYPTRFSLNELERRLPSPPFLRIHRAFVANMRNVVEISPCFNGTYVLRVNDTHGTELTVSRGRVKDLRTLLGL